MKQVTRLLEILDLSNLNVQGRNWLTERISSGVINNDYHSQHYGGEDFDKTIQIIHHFIYDPKFQKGKESVIRVRRTNNTFEDSTEPSQIACDIRVRDMAIINRFVSNPGIRNHYDIAEYVNQSIGYTFNQSHFNMLARDLVDIVSDVYTLK